ncbi:MAG TPA: hypothetical protein VN258_14840 [Mobilitalea sp.]|nr:hypothetical protein [Mobilitalea sp.]
MPGTMKRRDTKDNSQWIQLLINEDEGKALTDAIHSKASEIEDIVWLSPLKETQYEHYRLYQGPICEKLKIKKEDLDYLPMNQPLWDAIGTSNETIILVECDNSHYLVGNCLTFMNKLKSRGYKVKLILLNVIHSRKYLPFIHSDWDLPYKKIFIDLFGRMDTPEDVIILDYLMK